MSNPINTLLKNVEKTVRKNDEIAKLKGESFNLFDLLDRRTDEVKTHSMFIAELLNPDGSHNMGDIFLKLFYDSVLDSELKKISYKDENTTVEVEKYIGKINEEKDVGGRLDIVISNSNYTICIENKIYADDQENQLERYRNYLKGKSATLLLYLTLYGTEYKNSKKGSTELKNGTDYYCISYKEHIINWLELCFEKSSNFPILRESIKQYIILLKRLTNQLSNAMEINKDIIQNLKESEIIKDNYDSAIKYVSNELKKAIKEQLIDEEIFEEKQISTPINGRFSSIFITLKDNEGIGIESFTGTGHRDGELFIGYYDFDKKKTEKDLVYKHSIWKNKTLETIWKKEVLFSKYAEYINGNKNKIVQEIIEKIKEIKQKYAK